MKKFLLLLIALFVFIGLVGCAKLDSLQWEVFPNSVYKVEETTEAQFKDAVKIKINDLEPMSLTEALDQFKNDLTISGLDFSEPGFKTLVIKYKSLSLYWNYQVVEAEISEVDPEEPAYDWYDPNKSTFEINTLGDLYGFANIVNGKDGRTAFDFEGKTVVLKTDIDLSGKIWTPIGEGPRKALNEEIEATTAAKAAKKTVTDLEALLNSRTPDFQNYYFVASHIFAKKVGNSFEYYQSIDMADSLELEGVSVKGFAGTFDGQGHKIIGLSDIGYTPEALVYASSTDVLNGYTFGLFGKVKGGATVKNLTFENVQVLGYYIDLTSGTPQKVTAEIDGAGSVIGYTFGEGTITVENINVLSGFINGADGIGGIIGRAYHNGSLYVRNIVNRATISSEGHTGGVVGYAVADVKSNETVKIGEIKFENIQNYGDIISSGSGSKRAGAIINYHGNAKTKDVYFINCRNFGRIEGLYNKENSRYGMWNGNGGKYHDEENCYNYGILN